MEKINEMQWEDGVNYSQNNRNYYFVYDNNNRIIKLNTDFYHNNEGREWIYTYDKKGKLKQMIHDRHTYLYSLDKTGNITKIDHYIGAYKASETITCQFDKKGRLIYYFNSDEFPKERRWIYDSKNRLVSFLRGNWEYKFEYDESLNIIHCVSYEKGDITIINGGYDYEISYTFYPTKEEFEEESKQLEEKEK